MIEAIDSETGDVVAGKTIQEVERKLLERWDA